MIPLFFDKFKLLNNDEPTEAEMADALKAKFQVMNANMRDIRERCERREFENDPFLAVQCLISFIGGGEKGNLSFEVKKVQKLGCEKATGEAGYICDYTLALSSNNSFMQSYIGSFLSNDNKGQGRFIPHKDGWLFLPIQE